MVPLHPNGDVARMIVLTIVCVARSSCLLRKLNFAADFASSAVSKPAPAIVPTSARLRAVRAPPAVPPPPLVAHRHAVTEWLPDKKEHPQSQHQIKD
jgi:hypothetical protein